MFLVLFVCLSLNRNITKAKKLDIHLRENI